MAEVHAEHAHERAEERQAEDEGGPKDVRRARGLEDRERAGEVHRGAVGRAVRGDDLERELGVGVDRVGVWVWVRAGLGPGAGAGTGWGLGEGDERRGGAEPGGEAVFVEAVLGPGAGVGDPARALDGGQLGLGADGLWSEAV